MDAERLNGFQTSWTNSWKTNLWRIKYKDLACSWSRKLESGRLFCGSIATCLSCFILFLRHLTLIIVGDKTKGLEWFPCRFPYSYSHVCVLWTSQCVLILSSCSCDPWCFPLRAIGKSHTKTCPLDAVLWVPFVALVLYHLLLCGFCRVFFHMV